ncbi:hypothetical protein ACOMHN_027913 [Nucella lapillus]
MWYCLLISRPFIHAGPSWPRPAVYTRSSIASQILSGCISGAANCSAAAGCCLAAGQCVAMEFSSREIEIKMYVFW